MVRVGSTRDLRVSSLSYRAVFSGTEVAQKRAVALATEEKQMKRHTTMLVTVMAAMALAREAQAQPSDAYDDEYEVADAIADAFDDGHAKAYRIASASQLESLADFESKDLESALRAYVDVAHERGVEGLEGALVSTAAALGARDFAGFVTGREMIAELDGTWDTKHHTRPNAMVAIARPGSPIVHYLPAPLVGVILAGQTSTGVLDIESVAEDSFCAPGAIDAFTARWGAELGAVLQSMCDGNGGGGGGGIGGDLGLGFGGEVSELDCLMAHQETRAERVEALMLDCMMSVLEGGGGNPLASDSYPYGGGSPFDWVFPLRETPYSTTVEEPDENGDSRVVRETFYTEPGGTEVYSVEYGEDGSTTTSYNNDAGAEVLVVQRDGEGNVERVEYRTPNGDPLRDETHHDDGSTSTVDYGEDGSRVETEYDDEGNIVTQKEFDADGEPVTPTGDPAEGFGETAECRELTMALIEANDALALMGAGAIDPRTVNPNPDADVEPSSDLDCFEFTGGALADSSFECRDELKLCNGMFLRGSGCACDGAIVGMKPERMCGLTMRCSDGGSPIYDGGTCTCTGEAAPIVDGGVAPGPRPGPVDRFGGRPVD